MLRLLVILALLASPALAGPQEAASRFRPTLIREAQAVYGLNAPVAMFAGQITQESNWRPDVTAWDNGRGLAQFMDGTAAQVARLYPELGAPSPYNPTWAIRAMVRLDGWNYARVQGDTACDRWAASLKGYNAGLGYAQRAQKRSKQPGKWFDATEHINAGQSAKNFEYSRLYPRWILFKHQPIFTSWGATVCLN
jgi:soluble lytic murein transglycosylase-like protein